MATTTDLPRPLAPLRRWNRLDTRRLTRLLVVVALLHLVGWGVLLAVVVPRQLGVGAGVFGAGLGLTAYTLGMRHAFDADHIAAIDGTTRKLMTDGQRPVSVGFWFSLGHSTVVFVMALLVAAGARFAGRLVGDDAGAHRVLGAVGTSVSGLFLVVIGVLNLVALVGIVQAFRRVRRGQQPPGAIDDALERRGLLARLLRRTSRTISAPWQLYPAGVLFGLGFDTATEISLLVLAGAGAASGLPWYAVMVLPVLFAAGMSLLDTLDGAFMNVAYHWAFANPVRKVFYNLTVTGLSVAVALGIGSVELVSVLHDEAGLRGRVADGVAGLDLDDVGYVLVGLFVVVWAVAVAVYKLARVEDRWGDVEAEVGEPGQPGAPDRRRARDSASSAPSTRA